MTSTKSLVIAMLGAAALAAAPASADPAPDLRALQPVDSDGYYTYSTYGAGGWQFVTPDGVRCRIMTVTRWGSASQATCWGAKLPRVDPDINYANAKGAYVDDPPRSTLGEGDLDNFETYRSYEHRSSEEVDHVDPASYHLLPAGRKLTAQGTETTVTCGALTADSVSCTVDATGAPAWTTGFVLSPEGGHTF